MIVVRIWEGLGNQMFQYAYARMLQEQLQEDIFLEGRRIYRDSLPGEDLSVERRCGIHRFQLSLKFIKPQYLAGWKYLKRKTWIQRVQFYLAQRGIAKYLFLTDADDQFSFHEGLMSVPDNSYIMGHFFHRKYIEPIRDQLLQEFTLKEPFEIPSAIKVQLENSETVSLHIRRGDYLYAKCVQTLNREMKNNRYYERAMKLIAEHVKNPVFLIFSDDIEWVKDNFECPFPHEYVSDMGFTDYQELMVMASCKHNIIANSTFSFWGGWLNQNSEKIVIAPKHWMPSIIPKDWVQI